MECQTEHMKGKCCCNCQHQLEVRCHPWNQLIGKGRISETMGYVCLSFAVPDEDNEEPIAIFDESKHGICEMHKMRENK